MNDKTEAPPLISITIRSIKDHPFPMAIFPRPQQAVIVGKSSQRDHSFEFTTGPLNPEQTRRCRLLQQHGSCVVEFTDEHHFFGWNQEKWQESIIIRAMEKMASLYPESREAKDLSAYNPEFAYKVLEVAAKHFPRQTSMVELKHALTPEPSNEELFTAIDALEADGYIEAKAMRGHPNSQIKDVAYIRATRLGRAQLEDQPASGETASGTIIHSQVNNYGPVGAIGTNAHGTVNVHNHSTELEHVDLHILAVQLEELRTAFRSSAVSREDDKQIALIGDAAEAAEKGDRKNAHSFLTRFTKPVLEKAQEIGTDVVAKTLAEMMKP
jgi:DNA-binding PadR family transcriptional regulator